MILIYDKYNTMTLSDYLSPIRFDIQTFQTVQQSPPFATVQTF